MAQTNGMYSTSPTIKSIGEDDVQYHDEGLTKREHFAAMALQGLMANSEFAIDRFNGAQIIAEYAVMAADALIEELNRKS